MEQRADGSTFGDLHPGVFSFMKAGENDHQGSEKLCANLKR